MSLNSNNNNNNSDHNIKSTRFVDDTARLIMNSMNHGKITIKKMKYHVTNFTTFSHWPWLDNPKIQGTACKIAAFNLHVRLREKN